MHVNVDDLDDIACACGNTFFIQAFVLKKVSALRSPTGIESVGMQQTFICSKCSKELEQSSLTSQSNEQPKSKLIH